MSTTNDPKMNPRFAAFFAKKAKTCVPTLSLLKKNDTSGMVLVGVLDNVRRMPAKRSPGSFCVTMIAGRCKIFDHSMFEVSGEHIILNKDANNSENIILKNFENILFGSFLVPDDIENNIGSLVKCHGFQRNAAGYLTCKSITVLQADKNDSVMGLAANIPNIDFETTPDKYCSAILQFRSDDQLHDDWKNMNGNACSLNLTEAVYATEDGELLFKGSAEAMSFDVPHQNTYLFELYWTAAICRRFGITNKEIWPVLAPALLSNFRGFIKGNIDIVASSGLAINDPDNKSEDYAGGYKIFTNHLEIDMVTTIKQAGEEITSEQLLDYFDDELFLESEHSTDNPLNQKTSLVRNLNEFSGSLKKIMEADGVKFYQINREGVSNIFCVLTSPLTKKRNK